MDENNIKDTTTKDADRFHNLSTKEKALRVIRYLISAIVVIIFAIIAITALLIGMKLGIEIAMKIIG